MELAGLYRRRAGHLGALSRDIVTFRLRQGATVVGRDFWIEDLTGRHVYWIDGTRSGLRNYVDLENAHGEQQCRMTARALPLWETIDIERPDGSPVAVVRRAGHGRWSVEGADGVRLSVHGSVTDREYSLQLGGRQLAAVSKRWFKGPATYGLQTQVGADPVLPLAVGLALDAAVHPGVPSRAVTSQG